MPSSEVSPASPQPPARRPVHPGWWVALGYVVLVLVAHLVGWGQPGTAPTDLQRLTVPSAPDSSAGLPAVTVAYRSYGSPDAPLVLLLHDDRHDATVLVPLAEALGDSLYVVLPSLPGFGASEPDPPSFSLDVQARYMAAFHNALGLPPAHVIGYGMGAALALSWHATAPGTLHSLTMLEGIATQEYYLLGDYRLNALLYGLQSSVAWLLRVGTPHGGALERTALAQATVRAGQALDLRPMRERLHAFEPPLLILHGTDDQRITLAAAEEHRRLVPQSTLVTFGGDDTEARQPTEARVEAITSFVRRVESGAAPTRAEAPADRVAEASVPFDASQRIPATGWTYVTLMLLLALMAFVSEDLTCIAAGLLVARGTVPFVPATIVVFVSIFLTGLVLYFLGAWLGRPFLQRPVVRMLFKPEALNAGTKWISSRGGMVLFLARFIPGSRAGVYIGAGILDMGFFHFSLLFLVSIIPYTPLLIWLTILVGNEIWPYVQLYQNIALPVFLVLTAGFFLVRWFRGWVVRNA